MRPVRTAARPIRLPTREIKTLAKKLAQRLYQYGLPKPGRVTAQEYLPLTNVMGDEVVAEILLTGTPGRNRDPFSNELLNGGFLKRRPEGPLMRVFVNPHLDPRSFEMRPRRIVEDELYRLLSHELTHAADIWSGKGSVGDLSGSTGDLKRHHHNHPAEVRALMRDVVTHLDDGDHVRDLMGYGIDFNTALREALKDTKWPDIEPYLEPRNKKTILKGVYTFLQDQGLDEGRTASAYRVAARYAGMLKAPPKMVEDITNLALAVTARWLAHIPDFDLIKQVQEARSEVRQYREDVGRELQRLQTLKTRLEWWKLHLSGTGWKPPLSAWTIYGDIYFEAEGRSTYEGVLPPFLRRRDFEALSPEEERKLYEKIARKLGPLVDRDFARLDKDYAGARKRVEHLEKRLTPEDRKIVDHDHSSRWSKSLEIAPEVRVLAKRDALKGAETGGGEWIPADWSGWEYAPLLERAGAEPGSVKVVLNTSQELPEVGGQWLNSRMTVFPRVPKLFRSAAGYKRLKREIRTAVRHELGHYVQDLFRHAGIAEDFGSPSRSIRDLRYSPAGFKPQKGLSDYQRTYDEVRRHGEKDYFLRDVEFYPWVEDSAEVFNEWALKEGLEGRPRDRARRDWVEGKKREAGDSADFWKALKKHEPAKWRKAVGEFWKVTDE